MDLPCGQHNPHTSSQVDPGLPWNAIQLDKLVLIMEYLIPDFSAGTTWILFSCVLYSLFCVLGPKSIRGPLLGRATLVLMVPWILVLGFSVDTTRFFLSTFDVEPAYFYEHSIFDFHRILIEIGWALLLVPLLFLLASLRSTRSFPRFLLVPHAAGGLLLLWNNLRAMAFVQKTTEDYGRYDFQSFEEGMDAGVDEIAIGLAIGLILAGLLDPLIRWKRGLGAANHADSDA